MKTIQKTLIPVSAVLTATLLPSSAFADLHIHKKVDRESVVVIGPEVDELSVGQQLRVETDGSVGVVTRIRGQKALVSVQSSDQLSPGDRVVLVRARERAGVVPAETAVMSTERSERVRRAEERTSSPLRLSFSIGANRPTNNLQQPTAGNPYQVSPTSYYGAMSYTFSILPEAALSYALSDSFRVQASGAWVQKRSATANNFGNNPYTGAYMNSQYSMNRTTIVQNSIQAALEAQYLVPGTPLLLSAGPFVAFPTSASQSQPNFGSQNFNQPIPIVNQRSDVGALIGAGFETPVATNIELIGMARYAHGTVNDAILNQRTRDARVTLGISLSL